MSAISERCWHAEWLDGTEFVLWKAVTGGPLRWGQGEVSAEDIALLRRLSEAAGGWIVWDDERGETFLPMSEWLQLYEGRA